MKKALHRIFRILPVLLGLVILVSLAACSSGGYGTTSTSTSTSSKPAAGQSTNAVSIAGFAFAPATLTVKVGTTVTWTNNDSAPHTLTSDNGVFDSGSVPNGKTYSYTFSQAGTFPYHCTIHPSMKGSIIVQ